MIPGRFSGKVGEFFFIFFLSQEFSGKSNGPKNFKFFTFFFEKVEEEEEENNKLPF